MLLIKDKAFIPADVLVLASSDSHGQAYVQTAQLDGERNLKPKNSLLDIQHMLCEPNAEPNSFNSHELDKLKISCEDNSKNLYYFAGYVKHDNFERS